MGISTVQGGVHVSVEKSSPFHNRESSKTIGLDEPKKKGPDVPTRRRQRRRRRQVHPHTHTPAQSQAPRFNVLGRSFHHRPATYKRPEGVGRRPQNPVRVVEVKVRSEQEKTSEDEYRGGLRHPFPERALWHNLRPKRPNSVQREGRIESRVSASKLIPEDQRIILHERTRTPLNRGPGDMNTSQEFSEITFISLSTGRSPPS